MERKQAKLFLRCSLVLFIFGCAGKSIKPVTPGSAKTPIVIKELEIQKPQNTSSEESTIPGKSSDAVDPKSGIVSPPQTVVLPKFGFIFVGGGAKSWAHIGVLKEMQKLKWPVRAVGGFEWGAVVAAAYAQNLSANEVEWELSKLKDFERWDIFIKAAFAKKMTADLKVPFVCSSLNIAKQTIYFLNRGQLDQLLPFCLSSPGLIKPINQSVAFMMDVPGLAQHMRATGVTKVILINVLTQKTKRSFIKEYDESDNIHWVQAAASLVKKPIGVDDVIEINLDDFGIKDLDKRRDIVAKGSELSYNQLKKLAEKYGL
ncbi:MAG: hypothetical protein A2622_06355 [Bdellovibrionales bacterium RIFCSPHIGHO2_01_FULL_40_29]|nr:MAG: hypothetical protein A2622_06355 [Bdellovibrionales bacterium RIFCSPHIGHO2_01_FULL_40_29]OFZ35067.1 MAG: hypothetical protein A3D17_06705 [Bdellovibrionales bacterium RIFCSPHIGHO2_02_FULL_40_15]